MAAKLGGMDGGEERRGAEAEPLLAALEGLGAGLCIVGAAGEARRVSPALLRLAGLRSEEIAGGARALLEALGVDEPTVQRARAGEPVDLGRRVLRRGSAETWWSGRLLKVGEDVLLLAEDLTAPAATGRERRLAERAEAERLRADRAEASLRALAETIPAAVLVADEHGMVTLASASADALFGATVGQPYGLTGSFTLHRPDGQPLPFEELPLARALERGEPAREVEILVRGHSWETPMRGYSSPVRDGAGRLIGAVSVLEDVAGRKASEQQQESLLEQALMIEATLETLLDVASEGLVVYGAAGEIEHMNPAAERLLGLSDAERRLPPWARVGLAYARTPEGEPFPADRIPAARALRGEIVRGVPMRFAGPGGAAQVSASAVPIAFPDGRIVGAISVFVDLSDRLKLERQREELIAALASELRLPLKRLRGLTRLLGRCHVSVEADELGRLLDGHVAKAGRVLESLIARSRLEAGELRVTVVPTDLRAFALDLAERFAAASAEPPRVLISPFWLGRVGADPALLERVAGALLEVVPGKPFEGDLVLAVLPQGEDACLFLARAGPGLADAELERALASGPRDGPPAGPLDLEILGQLVALQGGQLEKLAGAAGIEGFVIVLPGLEALDPALEMLARIDTPRQD